MAGVPVIAKAVSLEVIDLGRCDYATAYQRQLEVHDAVRAGSQRATVLFVEHDPVITISRRRDASKHLHADAERLSALGVDVQQTDRGGDVTYHGPGQLVAYSIVNLAELGLNVRKYIGALEQSVIDAVAPFGVAAGRVPGKPGAWVESDGEWRKLAAIGVRIKRNVSLHGLALNVSTDLSHFDLIVPCGLTDCRVSSLAEQLGSDVPTMTKVKTALAHALEENLYR